ncbi:NF1, partial [Cervus elaphus hippelaphus]
LPIKTGQQNTHTKVSTEHNKECLINISKYKFSLVISGLTTILKNVNNMLLPEICHFLHTCREGNQHAAELRNSASGVLFSLSCNNFNAVFSRISTRLQELTVCSEDNVDVHDIELLQYINVDCAKLKRLLKETAFKFKALKKVAQLAVINSLEKAFWNWVENYPDEFTKLYQIPQTDMAECAEKLFDLVDGFAESTKRKAAVWPLQIILLILCPEIIQDISKDVVDENNMNKICLAQNSPSTFHYVLVNSLHRIITNDSAAGCSGTPPICRQAQTKLEVALYMFLWSPDTEAVLVAMSCFRHLCEEADIRDLDQASMEAVVSLLAGLPLQPEEGD